MKKIAILGSGSHFGIASKIVMEQHPGVVILGDDAELFKSERTEIPDLEMIELPTKASQLQKSKSKFHK